MSIVIRVLGTTIGSLTWANQSLEINGYSYSIVNRGGLILWHLTCVGA